MLDMDKILTKLTGEEDITLITLHNIPARQLPRAGT